MQLSATYICPVRGLDTFEPPEPRRLGQAAGIARGLGIDRLLIPVLEGALLGRPRDRVSYLDGIVQALERISEKGGKAWFMAPALRVLGVYWPPPYLVRGTRYSSGEGVYLEGKIRHLRPFKWWADPSIVQKRIMIFREIVSAVHGHPALSGWLILDRDLEWSRPDLHIADVLLKSYLAEIRDRDGEIAVYLGLSWNELLIPHMIQGLSKQVDGLRLGGLENWPQVLEGSPRPIDELWCAAYLGALGRWLFDRATEVEIGWRLMDGSGDPEEIAEALGIARSQGMAGLQWVNLIDPEPMLYKRPPWAIRPGLGGVGLLDSRMDPKEHVESWFKAIHKAAPDQGPLDFFDIEREEYLKDPPTHFTRLWSHFRESISW